MSLLHIAMSLFIFAASPYAFAESHTKSIVVCSSTSGGQEGFLLASVSSRRTMNTHTHLSKDHDVLFKGTYDTSSARFKASATLVDEDGEEIQVLASVDASLAIGEHLRLMFFKPSREKNGDLAQVELVCNAVKSH